MTAGRGRYLTTTAHRAARFPGALAERLGPAVAVTRSARAKKPTSPTGKLHVERETIPRISIR